MLANQYANITLYLGAALSIGIAALSTGFGNGHKASATTTAMMRQPGASDTLLRTMLISQAVTESGAIFALVISLLLLFGGLMAETMDWARMFAFLAAGLAIGLGTTGPNLGASLTGDEAIVGVARTPSQNVNVTSNMLIGMALSQTSAIFALVVALLLIYVVPSVADIQTASYQILKSCAYLGAAFSIGIGTLGPGFGIGFVAGEACKQMSRKIGNQGHFMRTMFLGAAVTESTAIYSLVVAFLLIFV